MTTLRRCCFALTLLLVLPLAGCFVVALEPLAGYMENVPAHPPALVGTWHMQTSSAEDRNACKAAAARPGGEKACTITFTAATSHTPKPGEYDGHYDIVMVDEKLVTTRLTGQLVELGPNLFLDITSAQHTSLEDHLLAVHSFWKVLADPKSVRLVDMNPDGVKEIMQQPNSPLSGVFRDLIVLTGETEKLQAFVQQHADDPKVFDVSQATVLVKP